MRVRSYDEAQRVPLARIAVSSRYTQSLEKEVQSLRHLREKSPSSGASPHDHPTSSPVGSGNNIGADALEDVRLSPAATISLIEIFFATYHPYFPILPEQHEFLAEYDSNRLLLWTVLAIASKGREDMPNVYTSLVEPVRRLASGIYAPQSRSLKTMQALLLLCVWPFPFQQTINDPSTMYCSLATTIGYQLGLHRPLHRSDFDENAMGPGISNISERSTWYGCFIVNHGLALRLGLPTAIKPGNAIISAVNSNDIGMPDSLLLDLHISYVSYLWTTALGDDESITNGQHPSPAHMISAFETQVAQMILRFSNFTWPSFLRTKLAGIRLLVYSFVLGQRHPIVAERGAPSIASASEEMLSAKALSAMITSATECRKDATSLQYWPVFSRYKIIIAACLGVFMAAKTADESTRAPLLETCKNNVQVLYGWSLYPRDSFARIAKHVATGIRRIESHGARGLPSSDSTGRPEVTSRMASNVGLQLIWSAKHGRTPEPIPRAAPAFPMSLPAQPQITVSQHPAETFNPSAPQTQQPEQVFGYSFGDIDDSMFLEDWNESDFTDIALDWQSMLPVPASQ